MNFSVLMSVYKKENPKHFELALNSILNEQSLKPTEFVLVCDGPLTPELYAVIDSFEGEYPEIFKVFRQEQNQGLGKALNFGLSKCSYDLVARADSDDICSADRFEKQIRYMKEHPDVAVLGSDIEEFNETPDIPENYKKMPASFPEVYEMMKSRNPVNHMTAIFRKNVILEVGSYMHLQYVEDYYMWARVVAAGYKIENINEPLVHARVGNGMYERRGSKSYIASWRTLNEFMLAEGIINKMTLRKNMVSIKAFVYMPGWLRKFAYNHVLRKNDNGEA